MRGSGTGLFRRNRKCAAKLIGISYLSAELVFCGVNQKCAHNPNEISAFGSELVFRQVPGKSIQGRRHAQRFGGFGGFSGVAPVDPIRHRVAGIARSPTGLCLAPARRLALRFTACSLAHADSRVRAEPPPTDPAGLLPGLGHPFSSSIGLVGNFWGAGVGQFSRAPKGSGHDARRARIPGALRHSRE